jgi:hypothetical protein
MQVNEIIQQLDSQDGSEIKIALQQLYALGTKTPKDKEIRIELWDIAGSNQDEVNRKLALDIIKLIEPNVEKQIIDFEEILFNSPGIYLPYALRHLNLESETDKIQALSILWRFVKHKDKGKLTSWRVFEMIFDLSENSGKVIERLWNEQIPEITRGRFLLLPKIRESLISVWQSNFKELRDSLIIPSMVTALEDISPFNGEIGNPVKLEALKFLHNKIKDIPLNKYDGIEKSLKNLEQDKDKNVQTYAKNFLVKLIHNREKREIEEQKQSDKNELEDIFQGSNFDAKINAIEKLVSLESPPSELRIEFFVKKWIDWIKPFPRLTDTNSTDSYVVPLLNDNKEHREHREKLADKTENCIRTCKYVVFPLIQQLRIFQDTDPMVKKRIIQLLADVSDPRFFYRDETLQNNYKNIKEELQRHAVRFLSRLLGEEKDLTNRENIARTLGNIGDPVAVDALAQAVVGEERTRDARQKLLAQYYLDPSKKQSEQAATMLQDAIEEAKKTLRLLQFFNGLVFGVGLALVTGGAIISIQSEKIEARLAGGLAGLGGLAGVAYQLVKEPLNRIQNSMSNLVQLETAFTSFIWELNLNGTYIQSQYIANGTLDDKDITQTVDRIEKAMNLTMNLVAMYAEDGNETLISRINSVSPKSGKTGDEIEIYGQHLNIKTSSDKNQKGTVAINHKYIYMPILWTENKVSFKLPELNKEEQPIWISLIVDGHETNAIPFYMLQKQ